MYSFNFKKKKKGFLLLEAALASTVYCMLALGFFTIFSGQFSMVQAGRTALQAQQYAEIDADTLKLLSYDDLTNSTKLSAAGIHTSKSLFTAVSGVTDWYDQVTIGNETTVNSDTSSKMRIATIKLYKNGDTLARYSIDVPLSSQGNNKGGVDIGTVVAWPTSNWYSDIASAGGDPTDYLVCNGQWVNSSTYPKLAKIMSYVPDYQGYFLRGLGGNSAGVGEYQSDAIRNIYGYFHADDHIINYASSGAFYNTVGSKGYDAQNNSDWRFVDTHVNFDASRIVPTANENRPVNKAVIYLIRAK